ncbi:hypothetical protein Desmer_1488 [Desulfosporosinus meridiei DSM 13257]|uniref:Uncharacterized protein n=1 Tax=Desulfosporosinus meridiei (strain ATCC BAA-275 / DSM 13257 / KCTC 12902 / NCIMB 13706 / S10) TaxID=768704 RepID=J7IXP9_DESMD|nr:hypothetical protein Desmer_1488 [Desulfosporosinus meridiei DSM 13257]
MLVLSNDDYLTLKLEWAKLRIEKLDEIEAKLRKMKELAEFARDYKLSKKQIDLVNAKIHKFQQEILDLDEQSRTFWLDAH